MNQDSVNMLVIVTVLSENVPQEHQLRLQAVFIVKSSSPVHQYGKHSLFIGWVVMGPSDEVQTGMGESAVHSGAQRAVTSPVNIYVQEGEVAFTFGLHGEVKTLVDAIQVVQVQLVGSMSRDDGVILVAKPAEGFQGDQVKRHIPEDSILHSRHCENLKSYISACCYLITRMQTKIMT
jgi:hypothetical protein